MSPPSNSSDKSTSLPAGPEATSHGYSGNLLSEALDWTADNVGKPIANAAILNPWNAIASTTNALTGHSKENPLLPEAGTFDIPKANFLSANWFVQGLSSGLGMIAPYVIAGRATGGAMRWSGETLGLEGRAAVLLKDEKIAQIAGAGIYDGMRSPGDGETRLGNSLAGIAGFTVFEYGNAFGKNHLTFASQIGKRAVVGFAGASAQQTVSHVVSEHRLPTADEYIQSGISGSVLNVALPPAQDAIMRSVDNINHSLGRGVPIEHYLSTHDDLSTSSGTLHDLIFNNPWARIQDRAREDAADVKHKIIQLAGDHPDPARLGHELFHLQEARAAQTKASYDQAAELLKAGKLDQAKDLFFKTHLDSEVGARVAEQQIGQELGTQPHLNDLEAIVKMVPHTESHPGHSYTDDTEAAFQRFVESQGRVRPAIEYGGAKLTPEESAYQGQLATELVRSLQNKGFIGVFAGGAVRDELMGIQPNDYDIATSATPQQVEQIFKAQGITVYPKGEAHGVMSVVIDGREFEIATLRKESSYSDGRRPDQVEFVTDLKTDAARRDLTINAMFKDPISGEIHDFFGGKDDLANGVIKAVGNANDRFYEDRLRMLRIPRFAARFPNFSIDPETLAAVKANAPLIDSVSKERVRDEVQGILMSPDPVRGLQLMMNTGLMKAQLPEIYQLRGPKGRQDPVWHPEGTAWTHTKMVVGNMAKSPDVTPERMWAALLHDVGKPATQKIWDTGGISNHGHDAVGADMTSDILHRLKLDNDVRDRVADLVRMHMKMHKVSEMRPGKLMDILERPDIMDLAALQHADATGTKFPARADNSQLDFILSKIEELGNAENPAMQLGAKPIINGDTLRTMDFKPGPVFSTILGEAMIAQREGEFLTAQDGQRWVDEHFSNLKGLTFNQQIAQGYGADQQASQ